MSDTDLSKKFTDYQNLAKENPNVDVGLLMSAALSNENTKLQEGKSYRWPYLISLGLPPFGLLYAVKYYLNGDEQDKTAANICLGLTVVSLILVYAFSKILFSSAGVTPEQIQQIKPSDINQLLQ
jgi:hypothetical protein